MYQTDFDAYDQEQLQKAKDLLQKVYNHNFPALGDKKLEKKLKRLGTIIQKLEVLQNM